MRRFGESDLENVYRGLSHPDIIKYYGVHYNSLEETKKQMAWFAELEKNETGRWWAICSKDDTIFYGAVGLNNVQRLHNKAEIGFWLFPDHWGKGLIMEVMPFVIGFGFNDLRLHRIEGFVESENTNSGKLMAKLDFRFEGSMKDCEFKNGRYISLDIYARLNPD